MDAATKGITRHFFWTAVLQGLWFVLFGVLILLYPPALWIFASVTFVWIGVTILILAYKLNHFQRSLG